MAMATHYFTFGMCHKDPKTGGDLRDYWVEIIADSSDKARKKMFDEFGAKWGFQYHERAFMKIYKQFPKGCYRRFETD